MLTLSQPLGRLPFFLGVSVLHAIILLTVTAAFALLPTGGGHLAVLVIIGALHAVWFVLHARRFADAGHRAGLPLAMAIASFTVFVLCYVVFASLWSVPEVQREAFRTAGGIGAGMAQHVETNPLVLETGRILASMVGVAGAVVVTGLVFAIFGVGALIAGGFSMVALAMPSGVPLRERIEASRSKVPPLPGQHWAGRR